MPPENYFPKVGDKLIFKGVPDVYFPHFKCMGEAAKKHLVVDNTYEVERVEVYSSWCSVWLKDNPFYPELGYNRSFFK